MKKLMIVALMCASFNAFAGCKPSDLYGRWFLLSVDKNETITRCHLAINKNGVVPAKSRCDVMPVNISEGFGGLTENAGKLRLVGCSLTGTLLVDKRPFTFDAVINPAKNLISGVIFGKTRAMVIINRE